MEEGSLLQEALSHASTAGSGFGSGGFGGPSQELLANNALVVDVYLLPLLLVRNNNKRIQYLLQLASIGVQLNEFIQSINYPWMSGGDGPVFGIHLVSSSTTSEHDGSDATTSIPCLRCCCRYGVSVQDEWKLIALMLEFSSSSTICEEQHHNQLLAIECWDEDDGQILLIESANVLPQWVDDDVIGPELCRHRCWIVNGQVHLIEPTQSTEQQQSTDRRQQRQKQQLSLRGALRLIGESSSLVKPNQQITAVIRETLKRRKVDNDNVVTTTGGGGGGGGGAKKQQIDTKKKKNTNDSANNKHSYYHKTVMVLPRSLALLIRNRPDLVNVACQSFVDNAPNHNILWSSSKSKTKATKANNNNHDYSDDPSLCGTCEDWVWTTFDFGKTQYAMMRTFLSNPAWKIESAVPPIYNKSIELKRLKRQSTVESCPHLHHAVPLGVRLVAGFDYLLLHEAITAETEEEKKKKKKPSPSSSHTEKRVLNYWNRIDRALLLHREDNNNNGDNGNNNNWLLDAWQAGPNHSKHDIESIMKCPVYDPEICDSNNNAGTTSCPSSCTPLSHPQETLASQIRRELLRKSNDNDEDDENTFFRRYPPGPSDVDNEEWMTMPDEEELRKVTSPIELMETAIDNNNNNNEKPAGQTKEKNGNNKNNKDGGDSEVLEEMLCGVQSFMKGQSTVEGVETETAATATATKMPPNDDNPSPSVDINPTVFLNILHATLKAQSPEELNAVLSNMAPKAAAAPTSSDPFFSERDYEMEEDSSSSGSGDDDDDNNNGLGEDSEMTELMQAMDQELLRSSQSISRSLDGDGGAAAASPPSDEVAESTHLLTNLLQSLDAGAGGPGPVQNILKEMGIQPPK